MCDNVHPVPGAVPLVPSSNGYEPGFKTQLMIKDMTLGVEAGEAAGIEPSMARTALDFYKVASEDPLCKVCCFLVLIFFPVDIMSGSLLNISQFHRSGMDRPYTFSSIKQRRRRRISPFFACDMLLYVPTQFCRIFATVPLVHDNILSCRKQAAYHPARSLVSPKRGF